MRPIAGGRQQQGVGARRAACCLPGSRCRGSVMPKRTRQLTLTDIRRRYDAERLLGCRLKSQSFADAWKRRSRISRQSRLCPKPGPPPPLLVLQAFPEDRSALYDLERQHRPPRRFRPRSESERVGVAVIFYYVILRLSPAEVLAKCRARLPCQRQQRAHPGAALRQPPHPQVPERSPPDHRGALRDGLRRFPTTKNPAQAANNFAPKRTLSACPSPVSLIPHPT